MTQYASCTCTREGSERQIDSLSVGTDHWIGYLTHERTQIIIMRTYASLFLVLCSFIGSATAESSQFRKASEAEHLKTTEKPKKPKELFNNEKNAITACKAKRVCGGETKCWPVGKVSTGFSYECVSANAKGLPRNEGNFYWSDKFASLRKHRKQLKNYGYVLAEVGSAAKNIQYSLPFEDAKALGDAIYGRKNPFRKIPDKSDLEYWPTRMLLNHLRQKKNAQEMIDKVLEVKNGNGKIMSGIKNLIQEKVAYALVFAIGEKLGKSLRNDGFASVLSDTAMVIGRYADFMHQCLVEKTEHHCGTTKHPASSFGGYIEKGGGGYLDCYRWKVPAGYGPENTGLGIEKPPSVHKTLLVTKVPGAVTQASSDWGQCNAGGATCTPDSTRRGTCAGYAVCDGSEYVNSCYCLMEVDKEDCYTVEKWE